MPFFLKAIKSSLACNVASDGHYATKSLLLNHIYQLRSKWIRCTNNSSKKLMKPNLSSTFRVMLRNPFSHQNHRLELLDGDAQKMKTNLTAEHDDLLVQSQHLPLVQDISWENLSKTQLAMHSPISISVIPLEI